MTDRQGRPQGREFQPRPRALPLQERGRGH